MCAKKEELNIYGNFNSANTRMVNVKLERCHGQDYCASDKEITEFFRNKYLLVLQNSIRFESRYYSNKAIVAESQLNWVIVNT